MVTHEVTVVQEMPTVPLSVPPSLRPGSVPLLQVVPDRVSVTLEPEEG